MSLRQHLLLVAALTAMAAPTPAWAASQSPPPFVSQQSSDNSHHNVGDNPNVTDPAPGCYRSVDAYGQGKSVCPGDSDLPPPTLAPSTPAN